MKKIAKKNCTKVSLSYFNPTPYYHPYALCSTSFSLTNHKTMIKIIINSALKKTFVVQWNLSKADTYEAEVFVHFRELSALERFELKSSQI